jgi:hypothetical protein
MRKRDLCRFYSIQGYVNKYDPTHASCESLTREASGVHIAHAG